MHFSQGLAAVVALGLCYSRRIAAQATTTAVCTNDTWTSNQEGMSPCVVGSALQAACNAGKWTIDPLGAGQQYSGPLAGESNKCQCSTVVYCIVSACGACQVGSVATWIEWSKNCTQSDISIGSFPVGIPSGISVPSWAYLNITIEGFWDPTTALANHNLDSPDSSAGSGTGTITGSGSSNPSSTSSSSSSSKSKSNAGAIAGGAVGGVVVLALIGIGACIFIRRRRRALATPASAQFGGDARGGRGEKVDLTGHTFGGIATPALPMQTEPPRLYDPSDPSTFPASPTPSLPGYTISTSPAPSAPYSQTSGLFSTVSGPLSPLTYTQGQGHGSQGHLHQLSQTTNASHGGYTGVPEI